jgi:hypothetical protein
MTNFSLFLDLAKEADQPTQHNTGEAEWPLKHNPVAKPGES